jgi:hypothetical protein
MKTNYFKLMTLFMVIVILMGSCKKDDDTDDSTDVKKTGILKFKTLNPMTSGQKSSMLLKSIASNPSLIGDTTITNTISLKLCIGDVWVSQGVVQAGEADDLDWIRLTSFTNTENKFFENYSFSAIEIPAGTYKSVKITFRNVFYRFAQLVSDTSIKYELLETMGSWTSPCDENDTTWANTNYFGPDGNHNLNDSNIFELVSEGEKLGGFSIEADKTATVSWRLGAGYTGICYTYLIDENHSLEWDCGIDNMEFECVPEEEGMCMWDFVVEYE